MFSPATDAPPSSTLLSTNLYSGTWVNTNRNSNSWTRIDLSWDQDAVLATFWIHCQPVDCQAGQDEQTFTGFPIQFEIDAGYARITHSVDIEGNLLQLNTFTDFVDDSGRSDYQLENAFRLLAATPTPQPTSTPTPMPTHLVDDMIIEGKAGYLAGVLSENSPESFTSTFVGAWEETWRGQFCRETLGTDDGSFTLRVPSSCFEEGETIYLTSGGLTTCVTVTFRSGERVTVELYGRRNAECPQYRYLMQQPMSHIFISYSRKDIDFAGKIVQALADDGPEDKLDTWIDWKSIPKGEDWEQEIYRGIEEADAFLFLISPDSVASEMCNKEIAHAVRNGKRILPIVIRDTDLKIIHPEISKRNWIFCREGHDDFKKAIEETRKTIHTDYEWLKYHTELQVKALKWEQKKDNSRLLRGKELREAEQQLAEVSSQEDPQPTKIQREYILAGQRNEERQRRQVTISLVAGLAIVAMLAIFAWVQRNTAVTEANAKATALVNEKIARSTTVAEANARATAQFDAINSQNTAVVESNVRATAQAVFYKGKVAHFINEKVPTLNKPTLKLLTKRGPLY